MEATRRGTSPAVKEQLFSEPYGFDFFQAVRLLEGLARRGGDGGGLPVGQDFAPHDEAAQFKALPGRSFAASEIQQLELKDRDGGPDAGGSQAEMTVAFMGLTGLEGVLPQHYTQMVLDRIKEKDYSLPDFFDLFNHRAVSFFYRAWEKYRYIYGYERARTEGGGEDRFTAALFCLVGLGGRTLRSRLEVDDECLLFFSGHFAHAPRAAVSLQQIIADYFSVQAEVEQFRGQWLHLDVESQSALPASGAASGQNHQLGVDVVVGERVWSIESKFRIRLGPLAYDDFLRFTPAGNSLLPLCQLTRFYVGIDLDFDVQPVLARDDVPWCQLGGARAEAALLGWNTWIRANPFEHDVDDAVFSNPGFPVQAQTAHRTAAS